MAKQILCDDILLLKLRQQVYGATPKPKDAIDDDGDVLLPGRAHLIIPTPAQHNIRNWLGQVQFISS